MNWPMVTLGEVLRPVSDRVELRPDDLYTQVTVRLWGKGLVLRGRVKGAEIAASYQNRVRSGQFVISKIDARHGAFGIVPPELDGAVVSNDFPAFHVDYRKATTEYVAWVSRTDWFISLCRQASEGSTNRVRLKEARFLAQTLPLPPLAEQRRIVAKLNAAASIINARTPAATNVEREIAATLAAAFARIAADAPMVPFGEIAPLVRRPVPIDPDGLYPELGVRSFGRGTFHKPSLSGSDVGAKKLFQIETDDLVFNIVFAWEGAVAVAQPVDAGRVGSHRFLTCIPDPVRATTEFLRFWFLTEEGLMALGQASPGGAGRNRTLGIKSLEKITVPLPSLDAQQGFDKIQEKARVARLAQSAADAELASVLPSMLHEAFGVIK